MIEEIKKEIEEKIKYRKLLINPKNGVKPYGIELKLYKNSLSRYCDFLDILDKYKDKEEKYKNEDINNKEVTDALCMLLSCSLKDAEFETQKEQFHTVYDYIKELEKYKNAWEELYSEKEMPCSIEYMQNLEDKHGIKED